MSNRNSGKSSVPHAFRTIRKYSNISNVSNMDWDPHGTDADLFIQSAPYSNLSLTRKSSFPEDITNKTHPNLQKTLTEFTLAYLVEEPNDIIDYAVRYFTKLQAKRNYKTMFRSNTQKKLHIALQVEEYLPRISRREPVCAECYDPEEDDSTPVVIPKTKEQYARLRAAVKNVFVFRNLDEDQLSQVLDAMFEKRVERGEIIIRQDDDGDYFYVVEKGHFEIYKNGKCVFNWKNSGAFGEIALMYQIKRTATVQAITEGLLWALDRQSFKRILLKYAYAKQKMYVEFLEKVPLLKGLGHWERLNLAEVLEPRSYKKGEVIINMGDEADGMYIIEKGTVEVYKGTADTHNIILNELGYADYFGELALLMHDKRQATVTATTDVKCVFLNKKAFERMVGKCIDILKRGVEGYKIKDFTLRSYVASISGKPEGDDY